MSGSERRDGEFTDAAMQAADLAPGSSLATRDAAAGATDRRLAVAITGLLERAQEDVPDEIHVLLAEAALRLWRANGCATRHPAAALRKDQCWVESRLGLAILGGDAEAEADYAARYRHEYGGAALRSLLAELESLRPSPALRIPRSRPHPAPRPGRAAISKAVLEILAMNDRPVSTKEILDASCRFLPGPTPRDEVSKALHQLCKRGLLSRTGARGRYRYASAEKTTPTRAPARRAPR